MEEREITEEDLRRKAKKERIERIEELEAMRDKKRMIIRNRVKEKIKDKYDK
jgi:hypothetical protein